MRDLERLATRELGKLPLSIGTAIAFEALATNPIGKIGTIAVNLNTMFRNVFASLPREAAQELNPLSYVSTLLEEMTVIEDVVRQSDSSTKVFFYLPDYDKLLTKFPNARVRTANTDKQKVYAGLASDTLKVLRETVGFANTHELHVGQVSAGNFKGKAVVFTNHAVDLLSVPFDTALLESHSGLFKYRSEWNTKLHSAVPLDRIPFNSLTLQVFGDSADFSPMNMTIKNFVLNLANERKWTPATTTDRVIYSLKNDKDQFSAQTLMAMMK